MCLHKRMKTGASKRKNNFFELTIYHPSCVFFCCCLQVCLRCHLHLLFFMAAVRSRERGHRHPPFALPLLPTVCVAAAAYCLCCCRYLQVCAAAATFPAPLAAGRRARFARFQRYEKLPPPHFLKTNVTPLYRIITTSILEGRLFLTMTRFLGIIADIDGTVTHNDRRLSVEALKAAHMISGRIPFVLASGNTLCFARAVSKMLGTRSPVIAENGGLLLPSYDAEPIVIEPCTEELNAALALLLEHFDLRVFDSRNRLTDVSFAKTVQKEEILPFLSDFHNIHFVDAEYAFHLTDKNICKGNALTQMAEMMGLKPKDFVAIGDSNNDIDMFHAAGLSFAVGSASDAVKKEADHVLQKGYGDGFAEMIDYLIQNDLIELEDERRNYYV